MVVDLRDDDVARARRGVRRERRGRGEEAHIGSPVGKPAARGAVERSRKPDGIEKRLAVAAGEDDLPLEELGRYFDRLETAGFDAESFREGNRVSRTPK